MRRLVLSLFVVWILTPLTLPTVPIMATDFTVATLPTAVQNGIAAAVQGDIATADRLFRDVYNETPLAGTPGCVLAILYDKANNRTEMFRWLEKTAEEYPNDPEAFLLLGQLALADDRFAEARLLANHGLTLTRILFNDATTDRKQELLIRGLVVLETVDGHYGKWESALKYTEEMVKLQPEVPTFLERQGRIYFFLGRYDEAVAAIDDARKKGGKSLPGPVLIAQFLQSQGKRPEAEKWLETALKTGSDDAAVLLAAASMFLAWDELETAENHLTAAKNLAPNLWDYKRMNGQLALFKADYKTAQRQFQEMLLENPTDSVAIDGVAIALCESSDPLDHRRAVTYVNLNMRDFGDSPSAQSTLIWVLYRIGQKEGAKQGIQKMIDGGTLTPMAAFTYALILSESDQKAQAKFFVEHALRSHAVFLKRAAAKKLLEELEKR